MYRPNEKFHLSKSLQLVMEPLRCLPRTLRECKASTLVAQRPAQWRSITVKPNNPFRGICYTCFGCETKTVFFFFKVYLRPAALSFKRSRRDLSIDVAEHRSVLKKYQNTFYPRFSFIPKTGIEHSPKRRFYSYCDVAFGCGKFSRVIDDL